MSSEDLSVLVSIVLALLRVKFGLSLDTMKILIAREIEIQNVNPTERQRPVTFTRQELDHCRYLVRLDFFLWLFLKMFDCFCCPI